jgi:hypothetical protein
MVRVALQAPDYLRQKQHLRLVAQLQLFLADCELQRCHLPRVLNN